MSTPKINKGFAAISKEKQKEIASKGGKAISADKVYMAMIGQRGGIISQLRRKQRKARS